MIPTSGLFGLVILVLDIIAIISIVAGRGSLGHKLLWTLLVLLLPIIGMVMYFLIGQSSKDAQVI